MRIKTKLQAIAILPLLVFVVATAIEYKVDVTVKSLYARGAMIKDASHTTMLLISLTYEYANIRSERVVSQWHNQYLDIDRILREMPADIGSPGDQVFIDRVRQHLQKSWQLFSELMAFDQRQNHDGSSRLVTTLRNNMVNRLILELQSAVPLLDKTHVELDKRMRRSSRQGAVLTVGIILSLALSVLPLAYFVINGINRAFVRLQKGTEAVAAGDLSYRVNLLSMDELGVLGLGFDSMTERLAAVTVSRDALVKETAERRQAEEALSASERRLREAQRIAQIGSWELDLTTKSLFWSDDVYQIFELDKNNFDATYEAFLAAIHPEDREMVDHAYAHSLATKTPYEIEHRLLMKDGSIKFVHERGETYYDSNGKPVCSLGTVQDISERRRTEEKIRKLNEELERRVVERTQDLEAKTTEVEETKLALMNIVEDLNQKTLELEEANRKLLDIDRLKSMFIAAMSHELRTPLNSIIGFSSIILDEWLGPLNEEQKEKLSIVLRTGKHLLSLINDLIDISKIEAGQLASIPEEFDLFDLISEAVGMNEAAIAEKGITLQVDSVHLPMLTDRRRLCQCVVNLLGNAAKFTRAGKITLKVAGFVDNERPKRQEMVAISVIDTGIGIKEEDLPKLFASFVRLTLPEDMLVKGTGLGLYLVKKIVTEILGGTVSVASVYGRGSEFCLIVPVRIGKA